MPLVELGGPDFTPILVYDAPVDEKTLKIREQFKVDEETGYPEHYKWRNMAKLGLTFRPEDPFLKFEYPPEANHIRSASIIIVSALFTGIWHVYSQVNQRRVWWSKPHVFLGYFGVVSGLSLYGQDYFCKYQATKNGMIVDYVRQHPERFNDIRRYKAREVLGHWNPRR